MLQRKGKLDVLCPVEEPGSYFLKSGFVTCGTHTEVTACDQIPVTENKPANWTNVTLYNFYRFNATKWFLTMESPALHVF